MLLYMSLVYEQTASKMCFLCVTSNTYQLKFFDPLCDNQNACFYIGFVHFGTSWHTILPMRWSFEVYMKV